MARVTMIALLVLSLGVIAAPGLAAQGAVSGKMASAERTVKDAGKTATREVTDSWLTLKTKLALLGDERVSSADVHVTTQRGVITLRGKVDSEAEQQAAEEIALNIEGAEEGCQPIDGGADGAAEDGRSAGRPDREGRQEGDQE